ncbi:hypothetical protein PCASD_09886 [Puccinia coronata f. sp. avenae]|uniref:Uncharacterized protein n=1 Tax=Puccinia coronata f. sp. avenae TaxID=200324 RepID=A0A2N5UI32_9BASI|nr:hypothetical protein PCASD_09886 [Puccinia coronata f. sp. avenae]
MFFNGASRVAAEKTGQLWGLIAARPKGVRTPIHMPKKNSVQPLRKGVQRLHALPRRLNAIRTPSIGMHMACNPARQACRACTPVWRACKACTPFGQACRLCTPVGSPSQIKWLT